MSADLDTEHLARLRLIRSQRIGPISYFELLRRFGSARDALDALPDLAQRSGGKPPNIASVRSIEEEIGRVGNAGASYLFHDDAAYPQLLRQVENAPPVMMIRGDVTILDRPAIAMVGARNASAAACRFARQLGGELAEQGYLVVSGLARGIDTAAHQGVMMRAAKGSAPTAGIIASGIDIAYPPGNEGLQEEMAQRALVIAEQPPGSEPLARNFPYRNRIIAGMALGTLVVEAAPRSGSLITARLAAEYGREVMAIPGSPLDSRSIGCNELIRNGAVLVQNVDDIIEAISPIWNDGSATPQSHAVRAGQHVADDPPAAIAPPQDDQRARLNELLSANAVAVGEIVRQSGFDTSLVQTMLMELEISGRLERHAGGKVSLIS